MNAHLNIGSNKGDSRRLIAEAVALVGRYCGRVSAVSRLVESAPWGFDSPNNFVNVGVEVTTSLSPVDLIAMTQRVERMISPAPHRDSTGAYIDREIDIDIVCIDDMVIDSPRLIVPHPRMAQRRFVLEPINELRPGWRHPLTGLTPAEMLVSLG